jgi:Methionine synthase I (cobalamin-dependent), methyltransferase domain
VPDLLEALGQGPVVCAEGYLFECERRGYLQAGAFVPEVVLDHPEIIEGLHREFVHAGSDVVEAFTYYGHREKLRGHRQGGPARAAEPERAGHRQAGRHGNRHDAGGQPVQHERVRAGRPRRAGGQDRVEEQVGWAAEAGVDFVIAETFSWAGEALLALEAIKAAGLPAVVTYAVHREGTLRDVADPAQACLMAEQAGADVVGLNCIRGPLTMLPLLAPIRAAVSCPVAALPVPYRTTQAEPSMQSLRDPVREGAQAFPTALEPFTCTRHELAGFTTAALAAGATYLGICCGAGPQHVRAMAEAAGKNPEASKYSPDMSRHSFLGSAPGITQSYREYAPNL